LEDDEDDDDDPPVFNERAKLSANIEVNPWENLLGCNASKAASSW